jgi:hypothetical protein
MRGRKSLKEEEGKGSRGFARIDTDQRRHKN